VAQTIDIASAPLLGVRRSRPPRPILRLSLTLLGVLPFFIFVLAFQFFPAFSIVTRTFARNSDGTFTLDNIISLNTPLIIGAYVTTTQISLITSILGGAIGFVLACAITIGGLPAWIKGGILSFSGVASNFAGVPLVFAFTSTLGRLGVLTDFLKTAGINLYPNFTLYGFWGLCIVYLYFQIPLMVLILVPAIDSLKKEWREASENLGGTRFHYWRYVALPILFPSIVGTVALLFGNAFGTQATAYALVGGGAGQNMVVTLLVTAQFSTDSLANPGLGNALAFGMIVVMAFTILIYTYCRRISMRWLAR